MRCTAPTLDSTRRAVCAVFRGICASAASSADVNSVWRLVGSSICQSCCPQIKIEPRSAIGMRSKRSVVLRRLRPRFFTGAFSSLYSSVSTSKSRIFRLLCSIISASLYNSKKASKKRPAFRTFATFADFSRHSIEFDYMLFKRNRGHHGDAIRNQKRRQFFSENIE